MSRRLSPAGTARVRRRAGPAGTVRVRHRAGPAGTAPVSRRLGPDLAACAIGGVAALSYAVTILLGRSLARAGVSSATALGFRFAIAALALGAVLIARRAPLLPTRGERLRLVLLGGVGYSLESTLFFLALGRGTAAAAALVFYAYPAIVALLEVRLGSPLPLGRLLVAVALSAGGTIAVVASGQHVAISAAGILFALGAASVFAVYLICGGRLVRKTDAWTRAAWVAGGAAVSSIGRGLLTHSFSVSGGHWAALLAYGAFTAAAFGFMFAALVRLGPTRTAVVMTLEAFFAVVLGAAFLHERLAATQLAGGVAIILGAGLVAVSRVEAGRRQLEPSQRLEVGGDQAGRQEGSVTPAGAGAGAQ